MWKKFRRTVSMRTPLVIMLFVIGFLPMFLQGRLLLTSLRQNQIEARTLEIQNQSLILSNRLTQSGYLNGEVTDTILDSQMDVLADVFNGRIVIVDGTYRIVRDTFNLSEGKYYISEEILRCFRGESSNKYNRDKHYIIQTFPVYRAGNGAIDGVMVVTASTAPILSLTNMVGEKTTMFEGMALILMVIGILASVRLYMGPIYDFRRALKRFAAGDMDEIQVDAYKETKEMSAAVSQAFTKLREVDNSRQEFVSNVSHELKTPITSIRVLADSLMSMENAPVELYQEFMVDISDEIDRESKIIDDLLSLVKMDKSAAEVMNISQVNIGSLLELILKRLRPIAKKRNIELTLETIREVTAEVDEVKIPLAPNNLVENAVKYNREDGWVRVTLDADHKLFTIKVADSGIGIPEEFQSRIFERFYRVDKARSRETGGTGLGLAITKNVIQMHRGTIQVSSVEGEGTVFTVQVPLTYIS